MTGFTDGFRTGYGLVSDVKDRELKKTQLENAQSNADRNFGAAEEDRKSTAAYRAEDLRIKNINAGADAEYKLGQLGIQKTTADTANISATTAQTKLNNLSDKTSIEYLEAEANIAAKNAATASSVASTNKTNQENDVAIANNVSTQAAIRLDNLTKHLGVRGNRTSEATQSLIQQVMEDNEGTQFDITSMFTDATQRGFQETQALFQDMSAGLNPVPSNAALEAISQGLGINKSAGIGRQITSDFVNAPEWMHDKGLVIESQGLYSASTELYKDSAGQSKNNLKGDLYVWTKDASGEEYPYFPPVTANRQTIDQKSLALDLTEVVQGLSAKAYMVNALAPQLKQPTELARIKARYGNKSDPSGVEAFQQRVTAKVNSTISAIKKGANTINFMGVSPDMSKLPAGTDLDEAGVAELSRNIEQEMLWGVPKESGLDRVQAWIETTTPILKSAPIPEGYVKSIQTSNPNIGAISVLTDIIPEEKWSPQLLSALNGYFDQDKKTGVITITDEEALTRFLNKDKWGHN